MFPRMDIIGTQALQSKISFITPVSLCGINLLQLRGDYSSSQLGKKKKNQIVHLC